MVYLFMPWYGDGTKVYLFRWWILLTFILFVQGAFFELLQYQAGYLLLASYQLT